MSPTERFYPPLGTELTIVACLAAGDPLYLDDPACPFAEETRPILRKISGVSDTPAPAVAVLTIENVENEARRLYSELKEYGESLGDKDSAERTTYFRLLVTLMEKLLGQMEQAVGVKKVKAFRSP